MLQTPPTSQPTLPKVPDNKAPLSAPTAPGQVAPPPRNLLQAPPISQPTVPQLQMTPPPKEMLQTPPASQPILPKLPDNKPPLSLPVAPVFYNTVQIAPPPRDMLRKPPTHQPVVPEVQSASPPRGLLQTPPANQPIPPKVPDNKAPLFVPIAPLKNAPPPRDMQQTPPTSLPSVPETPPSDPPATSPPHNLPRYAPPIHPEGPKVPPSISPESDISPVSTTPPSFNPKKRGIPVAAPSHAVPKQFSPPNLSPAASPQNNSPRDAESASPPLVVLSPTPLPSTASYRHHGKMNISSPGPSSYLAPPPESADRGKPLSPGSPRQTRMPFLSPEISPSVSSPMIPKIPHLRPIQAFPPPPPNAECKPLPCDEPLTNTLPGFPCGCILPMQVGLRLSVSLYTFFPLVSEFATEVASGAFMKQSQVRIMGANAATEDPEKTIVLMDLVPFGEDFDNNTAYLTYQRFWHKQVPISTFYFGDYEVLYVRYTGLPDSPPSAPLSDTEPHDSKGGTIKPVGVDIRRGQHKKGLKGSVIAVIVLSALIAMVLICAIAWIMFFRHRDHDYQVQENPQTKQLSLAKSSGIATSMTGSGPSSISPSYNATIAPYTGTAKTFTLNDMERATDNFAASRVLGEGGFGLVYGGVLEDGTKVAVKVLKRDDQQGDREFLSEVEMLSRLHHRNLVALIGICTEEHARCLIYELIPNGSVESHLHGIDKEDAPLDWGARLKIALGAARGLAYLHEDSSPRVIHRDFKSSNILLEHDYTPKVSDFGLARSALDEESRHISTRVMGTFGYVAPEYAMTGHLLVKSDVYSYGVVLLELLTGRKPVDMSQPPGQENLVTWSRPLLTSEEGLELIVDKSLGPNFPFDSISKVAAIASMCVQSEVSHRPFMGEVVQALKLVSNECDATKDLGSRSCSQEDLSVDFDARSSTHSDHLPDRFQIQSPLSDYESAISVDRGLPLSELYSTSAKIGKTDSESFRRHSSSGPLRSESVLPLWQRMRRSSGGSVSEHGAMFKLWNGYH
nr:PREDICTED: receptor-like serine/threonine-protein kinase ALE2 isoform X4 [Daucus carota subsp. sativus]